MLDVKRFQELQHELFLISVSIGEMGDNQKAVGNHYLAKKFYDWQRKLYAVEQGHKEMFHEHLNNMVQMTEQSTTNMLEGVFAGIKIGKENNEQKVDPKI